ncbi:coiled-coil domain-containing protein 18 isoform X2 [Nerophis ophidion]|uniref:coiled-coil domain-containing protein 18 isoform X2 n=1 Tax=Nerophis ophidion TaxID=159077 RepID=UPI002ADFDFFF|nr:coiled-coil domain-containing protein 18 isoform X2 [Nerophis ophidion]
MDSVFTRRKMCNVRQENACLNMQDIQLISDIDDTPNEFLSPNSQACLRCSRNGVANSVEVLNEQICHLQAEVETKGKELKAAELKAECCLEESAHSDIMVVTLSEKLSSLREDMANKTALCKRAEQQRNQALENAEKLKEAFKEYKANVAIKFRKVMENERRLKSSLTKLSEEEKQLELKCALLEREKEEQSETISQLKEEVSLTETLAAQHSDLQAKLEDAGRRSSDLRRQLIERSAECRELVSLRKEVEDLRTLAKNQEQCLAQSHRAAQQSQAENASLEAIISLLHLREDAVGPLCVRPCILPPADYSRTVNLLNLKPGEGYQQLLQVLHVKEAERTKQSSLVDRLQERVNRAQEEISSLQAERASHLQNFQAEKIDKANQASAAEKELKRKGARVSALEKQLQEKTSAYSHAALRNTELEKQLQEKTSTLQHYQSLLSKKQKEFQLSLDKSKQSQTQQYTEQQHRIDMLQLSVDKARSQLSEMEQELRSLQRERDEAHTTAFQLHTSIEKLTQEKQIEVRHNEELLHSLNKQTAESASKVGELQSSLSACREELRLHLQQMEVVKKSYEANLQTSKEKVCSLQEKLHGLTRVAESASDQNLQLQLSLQQLQTMLTESTTRIAELEESQSQLQRHVSTLEQQLVRARVSLQDEARNRLKDAEEKDKDLHEVKHKSAKLSEMLSQVKSDMKSCQMELVSKELELQRLRRDVAVKTSEISNMDVHLQQTRSQLETKSDLVDELEEKLHRCEADKQNCVKRVHLLEGQLQTVQEELAETLTELRLLKDVLQRTQTKADERQVEVENLSIRLSETQRELEDRTHEVLDMDIALKKGQGELQQRANVLAQLNVAIRDSRQKMDRKLEAKEEELTEAQRELVDTKDSHQQKLQTLLRELEESQFHCEALTTEVEAIQLKEKDMDVRLRRADEELALKEAWWQQSEAKFQKMIASLEQKLELEQDRHNKELESLQQTRGQLLKVSTTMRTSQEQLTSKLEQCQTQLARTNAELDRTRTKASHLQSKLEQSQNLFVQTQSQLEESRVLYEKVKADNSRLQVQLEQLGVQFKQARVPSAQLQTQPDSNGSLLIKESEVTRLQPRTSGLRRGTGRRNPTQDSSAPRSPNPLPATVQPPSHAHRAPLPPNAHSPQDDCFSSDLSIDFPPSLKAAVKEARTQQAWESSCSDTIDPSLQSSGSTEPRSSSEVSFDPLTYNGDKISANHTLEQEGNQDLTPVDPQSSLTETMRFVQQTLAYQEDQSLWSSA